MMITSKFGISPMSLNVIDSVIKYSNEHQIQLMFIASRNQIECAELGGGYVEGLTSEKFVNYIRKQKSDNILICRDHSGPYMTDEDVNLKPEVALEKTLLSIKKDINAGFDLIHIDCSNHKGDVYEATSYLVQEAVSYAESLGRSLLFEVGTEENIGVGTDIDKFRSDLEFITLFVQPEFVVGQTGSLVKEVYQVGYLNYRTVKELVSVAHSFGVKFKEHNVDYSSLSDLHLRREVGVDAINVGPEFGVVQTKTVIGLAQRCGLYEELDAFLNRSFESGKWRKWVYGQPSDFLKALIAGHYVYTSDEYQQLIDKLNSKADVNAAINERIIALLDHYVGGMS